MTGILSGCSVFGIRSGYEQLDYTVIDKVSADVKVRTYPHRIVAEVSNANDDNDVFTALFVISPSKIAAM